MDDLIPSKQISDYLKEKNVEFTDFEKATLIFNNKFLSKDTKHQKLKEIAQKTENQELKKQIQERLQFIVFFLLMIIINICIRLNMMIIFMDVLKTSKKL